MVFGLMVRSCAPFSSTIVTVSLSDLAAKFVQYYMVVEKTPEQTCRHVQMDFWPTFCAKAGVFCMGEVFGGNDVE